ncbi:MAG: hypothetical protein ACO2PN_27375 [Pyrobaculum sp.]|jgi:hypothetical protein
MTATGNMIAIDAGVRITKCYSYLSRSIELVGIAAIVAVADNGLIDKLIISTSDPDTKPYEEELARHYSHRYSTCVFDGPPLRICRQNIGIIKTGRLMEGWRCTLYGPYAVCADFLLDEEVVKKAVRLNSVAHSYAYDTAKAVFRYELLKRRCVTAEGIHPIPELSYFQPQ